MSNYFNLYEFMKILTQFAQHYQPNQLRYLNRFEFTFGCRSTNTAVNDNNNNGFNAEQERMPFANTDPDIIGTGGKLLEALKELMQQLIGIKNILLF